MSDFKGRAALLALLPALLIACGGEFGLPPYDGDGVRYPVSMAADPSGRWLYVVGANFDRQHRGGIVRVLDTQAGAWIKGGAVEVPSHAAGIVLQANAGVDGAHRLFVSARDDDSISAIDILGGDKGAPTLDCGQPAADLGPCDSGHRIGGDLETDPDVGADPVETGLIAAPNGTGTLMHVVATGDGRVTLVDPQSEADAKGLSPKILDHMQLGAGLSALATSPLTGRTYVADARLNRLYTHDIELTTDADTGEATGWAIDRQDTLVLPRASGGEYARGMTLSTDGSRLYIAYRSPNALLIVDIAPTGSGAPANALVDTIGIGGRPAQVVVAPTGPKGRERIYVSCYGTDDIWVVDPELRAVVDVFELVHSPYGMAVVAVPDGTGGQLWRLYTGLFTRHEVVALAIDPSDKVQGAVVDTIQ